MTNISNVAISNTTVPRLQMSDAYPYLDAPSAQPPNQISGAAYGNVQQCGVMATATLCKARPLASTATFSFKRPRRTSTSGTTRAMPTSANSASNDPVGFHFRSTLPGLTSRCTTDCACKKARAPDKWLDHLATVRAPIACPAMTHGPCDSPLRRAKKRPKSVSRSGKTNAASALPAARAGAKKLQQRHDVRMRQSFEDLRLHALGLCLNELHGAGSPAGNFDGAVHLAMGSAADACPHIVLGQKRVKHRRGPGPRFSRGRPP